MEHFIEIGLPLVGTVSEDFKSDGFDIISVDGPFIALLILVSCFCRHEGFAAMSYRLCVSALIYLHQSTIGNLTASDLIRLHLSGRQLGHPFDFMTGLFGLPRFFQLPHHITFDKLLGLQRHRGPAIAGPEFLQCPRLRSMKGGIGLCIG